MMPASLIVKLAIVSLLCITAAVIMFQVIYSEPANCIFERHPELQCKNITIKEVFLVVGEGLLKDEMRLDKDNR